MWYNCSRQVDVRFTVHVRIYDVGGTDETRLRRVRTQDNFPNGRFDYRVYRRYEEMQDLFRVLVIGFGEFELNRGESYNKLMSFGYPSKFFAIPVPKDSPEGT